MKTPVINSLEDLKAYVENIGLNAIKHGNQDQVMKDVEELFKHVDIEKLNEEEGFHDKVWEVVDGTGVLVSGTEASMSMIYDISLTPENYNKENREAFAKDWYKFLKLVKVQNITYKTDAKARYLVYDKEYKIVSISVYFSFKIGNILAKNEELKYIDLANIRDIYVVQKINKRNKTNYQPIKLKSHDATSPFKDG